MQTLLLTSVLDQHYVQQVDVVLLLKPGAVLIIEQD